MSRQGHRLLIIVPNRRSGPHRGWAWIAIFGFHYMVRLATLNGMLRNLAHEIIIQVHVHISGHSL